MPTLIAAQGRGRRARDRADPPEPRAAQDRLVHGEGARSPDRHDGRAPDGRRRRRARRPTHPDRDRLVARTARPASRSTTRTSTTPTRSSRSTACRRSLAVIGGGVIGCEYACMFAALGVEGAPDRAARPACSRSSTPRWASGSRAAMAALGHRAAPRRAARARRTRAPAAVDVHAARRARRSRPTRCSSRPAAPATPPASASRRSASSSTSAATSRSTTTSGPRCRASTRPAT